MQSLGVILTPYGAQSPHGWYAEIAQARGGRGTYLPQPGPYPTIDRYHNTRGEVGLYYDTQLGRAPGFLKRLFGGKRLGDMIPTDAELAKNTVCYTPVHSGWINTPQGYLPNPWRFGWNPAGQYGPSTSLSGLGVDVPSGAIDVVAAMNAHNRRMFNLAVVSTAAVSISAMFTLWARWKRLRHDLSRKRRR